METCTRVNGKMIKQMVMEYTNIQMGLSMLVTGKMTFKMGWEKRLG